MKSWKLILATLLVYSNVLAMEKDEIGELENLYYNKKYDMALIKSEVFVSKHPRSRYIKSLSIKMGEGYYIEKKYRIAIATLRNCAQKYELTPSELNQVNILIAKSYIQLGNEKEGLKFLEKVEPISKKEKENYIEAIIIQSRKYVENGKVGKAINLLQENIKKIDNSKDLVLNMILILYNEGKYKDVIEYLKKYNCDNYREDKLFVNYTYGASYYKLGDSKKAKKYLEPFKYVIGKNCYKDKALLILVEIYLTENRLNNAKEILYKTSEESENYDAIMNEFGDYYLSKGEIDKSQLYYNKMKKQHLNDLEKIYSDALSNYKNMNYEKSEQEFKKLLNGRYRNESFYYLLAIEYHKGNYKKVIEEADKKRDYKLTKDQEIAINSIIIVSALRLNEYKVVEKYYEDNYKLSQTSDNLYHLIILENKLGNKEKMDSYISEYKKLFYKDKQNLKNIILIEGNQYRIEGYPTKAIKLYKNYLKEQLDYDILDGLVEVLISERRYKEALEYLDKYNREDSRDRYLRGLVYMGLGDHKKAELQFIDISSNDNDLMIDKRYNEIKNYFLAENYSKVIELGKKYLDSNSVEYTDEILDKMAISAFRLNDYRKAREFFELLKNSLKKRDYAQFQIGEMYYSEKDYIKAAQAYGVVARQGKSKYYKELGAYWQLSALAQSGDENNFTILLKKFLEQFPKSKMTENLLMLSGEFYLSIGEDNKGVEIYRKLYSYSKNLEIKQRALAKILDTSEKNNKMVTKENKKLIDNIVDKNEKFYYLGKFYKAKGEDHKAIEEFEKLIGNEEFGDSALSELGDYYYENEEYDKALYYYKKIIVAPVSAFKDKALFRMGEIEYRNKDDKKAFSSFAKVCTLYPKSKYVINSKIYLAKIYEENKEYEEAARKYRELYEITGEKMYLEKIKK